MAVDFNAERGELNFQASYSAPMFGLWRSTDELFRLLFGALSKYGLRLNDLKWGPASGIGDAQLNFSLLNYAATVRVKMDRVEIEMFDSLRIDEQQPARCGGGFDWSTENAQFGSIRGGVCCCARLPR